MRQIRTSAAYFVYGMVLKSRVFVLTDELLSVSAISGRINYLGNKQETLVCSGQVVAGDGQRGDCSRSLSVNRAHREHRVRSTKSE